MKNKKYIVYDFVGDVMGFVIFKKNGYFNIYPSDADCYDWIYTHIKNKFKNCKFKRLRD